MPHPPNRLKKLRLTRHQTKTFEISVSTDAGRAAKLSSANIIMSVRLGASSPVVIRKEVGDGIQITDPANGKAVVTLTSADTGQLEATTYRYDIWVIYPAVGSEPEVREPVVRSDLIVSESVTDFT